MNPQKAQTFSKQTLLRIVIFSMAALALLKFSDEFRLFFNSAGEGSLGDLRSRYEELHQWFSGISVYREIDRVLYPPASYVLLWPFMGWLSESTVCWLWTALSLASLGGIATLLWKQVRAASFLEKLFFVLIPVSMNATGDTLGRGQLSLFVIFLLLACFTLLKDETASFAKEAGASLLFLLALVKPTISAPFFLILCVLPRTFRPALMVLSGYIILTFFAARYQPIPLIQLFHDWSSTVVHISEYPYGDLYSLFGWMDLKSFRLMSSLIILFPFSIWISRNRSRDLWLLLGVTAMIARVWTEHYRYDDLLLIFPMIVLFQRVQSNDVSGSGKRASAVLLVLTLLTCWIPTSVLYWESIGMAVRGGHSLLFAVLLFFMFFCCYEKRASPKGVVCEN